MGNGEEKRTSKQPQVSSFPYQATDCMAGRKKFGSLSHRAIEPLQESRGIKLSLGKDNIVFSARAPQAGDAQVSMAINYKDEPMEIGFNPQFLTDVLRVINTEDIDLELSQPERPGLIKSGANFLYVLMPINLS